MPSPPELELSQRSLQNFFTDLTVYPGLVHFDLNHKMNPLLEESNRQMALIL